MWSLRPLPVSSLSPETQPCPHHGILPLGACISSQLCAIPLPRELLHPCLQQSLSFPPLRHFLEEANWFQELPGLG